MVLFSRAPRAYTTHGFGTPSGAPPSWLRRALSEAGEGTVLARPEAQLSTYQHKSVVRTAGDHDITYHNHNENIPCGL